MKKKIVLITNMYPSNINPGKGIFCKKIYKYLSDNEKFDVECVKLEDDNNSSKIVKYLKFYFYIFVSIFKYKNADFYVHYVSHSSLPLIISNLLGAKRNMIAHVHGGDVKLLKGYNKAFFIFKNKLVTNTFNISSKIIVPSLFYRDYLYENFNVYNKVVVYPSGGVSCNFFNHKKESVKKLRVGFAGRLEKTKNVVEIVNAIGYHPDIELSIVGTGRETNRIKSIILDKNLKNVSLTNMLTQVELALWYREIDILIYPSSSESLGLVPLEAMASGTYCILSNIPAFNEFSMFGLKFHTLSEISADEISKAINSYLKIKESNILDIITKDNIRIVQEYYSSENVNERLLNVFE